MQFVRRPDGSSQISIRIPILLRICASLTYLARSWPRPQQGPSLGFNLNRDLCLGLALALGLYLPSSHFLLSAFPMKLDLFPQRYAFSYEFRKWNQSLLSIHLGWLLNVHHSPKNSMQPPVAGWAFSNPSFGKRKAGP